MRQELITPSLFRRLGDRANLSVLFLVGGMFCLFRTGFGPPGLGLAELLVPFILLLAHLALAPLPWQWTGDEAPMAGLGRGILQALVFNLAWVLLLLAALHLTGPEGRGGPGPRPGQPGPRMEDRTEPGMAPRMEPRMAPEGPSPLEPRHRLPGYGLILVNVAFAIVFGRVLAAKEATEARERATEGLLRRSRSRALQNQLEPHVLYNALNGLAELVHDDPLAAEEMIARLADLYRMLTHHGEAELAPLMKERLLVEAYLAMEEMRLGDRLRTVWAWPPWADGILLPPLFLQPLVENAIKHGLSPCEDGGELRIALAREGEALVLSVANTGRPLAQGSAEGVGLANLKARLALWDDDAAFALKGEAPWTVAEVRWTPAVPA